MVFDKDHRARAVTSMIIHVPQTKNSNADSLARSVRSQPSYIVHMDAESSVWFTESI